MCRGHCAVLKMIKSCEHQNHYPYGIERLVLGSAEVKRCILFTDNRESIQAERRAESQFVVSDDQRLLLSEDFYTCRTAFCDYRVEIFPHFPTVYTDRSYSLVQT